MGPGFYTTERRRRATKLVAGFRTRASDSTNEQLHQAKSAFLNRSPKTVIRDLTSLIGKACRLPRTRSNPAYRRAFLKQWASRF